MTSQGFDVAGGSNIGQKRSENQDHFLVASLRRQLVVEQTDVPGTPGEEIYGCLEGALLVVADGMGGHRGGELASRTAVEASARYVLDMMQWFLKLSTDDEQEFEDELSACLRTVQQEIWSVSDVGDRQMGTTVTMAYLLWPRLFVVHAGDSRCYLLRDGQLRQLTTDHTIAQQLISDGGLAADDPAVSNWRHVLWNCVGGDRIVRPEVIRCELRRNDTILLCSDGLTGMIDDHEISSIVTAADGSQKAVQDLITAANQAGGNDNISVIVCHINQPAGCTSDKAPRSVDSTIHLA